jgi:hypothetical protein
MIVLILLVILAGFVLVVTLALAQAQQDRRDHPQQFLPDPADRCLSCSHRRCEHGNLSGEWTLRFPCLHSGCTCPAYIPDTDQIGANRGIPCTG